MTCRSPVVDSPSAGVTDVPADFPDGRAFTSRGSNEEGRTALRPSIEVQLRAGRAYRCRRNWLLSDLYDLSNVGTICCFLYEQDCCANGLVHRADGSCRVSRLPLDGDLPCALILSGPFARMATASRGDEG